MATGGEAVGRMSDGRVLFVRGASAHETVRVVIDETKKRFARGRVVDVVDPSPDRRTASCTHQRAGQCGGCDWQFVAEHAQRDYKRAIVSEQLDRLGGVSDADVRNPTHQPGTRTTVRCVIVSGRAGYRARRSDQGFAADQCQAVHPLIEELITDARFGDATEVTLRCSVATGERIVITDGPIDQVDVPPGVRVVSFEDRNSVWLSEDIGGRTWRVSGGSFFQNSVEGAEALVGAVTEAVGESTGPVIDLYAGVGLLGGVAAPDQLTCAVESNPSSIADAKHNLPAHVEVVNQRVERWKAQPAQTVIADPSRRGLAESGVQIVEVTAASRLVLVSCDPASLGRDTALLQEQGWCYQWGQIVDLFPDTSRIEVVSLFSR